MHQTTQDIYNHIYIDYFNSFSPNLQVSTAWLSQALNLLPAPLTAWLSQAERWPVSYHNPEKNAITTDQTRAFTSSVQNTSSWTTLGTSISHQNTTVSGTCSFTYAAFNTIRTLPAWHWCWNSHFSFREAHKLSSHLEETGCTAPEEALSGLLWSTMHRWSDTTSQFLWISCKVA